MFDPNKENERENYYYSLLLLFVPFRKEAGLLGTNETAEEAFKWHLQPGSGLNLHHDKLQQVLLAQTKVREISEAREQDQQPPAASNDEEVGPQVER